MWHVTGSVSASHCSRKQNLVSSCRRVAQRVQVHWPAARKWMSFCQVKSTLDWNRGLAFPGVCVLHWGEYKWKLKVSTKFRDSFYNIHGGRLQRFLLVAPFRASNLCIKQGTSRLVETFSNYCGNYLEISLTSLMSTMRGGEWRLSSFVISPIDLGEAGRCLALVAMWSSHNVVVLENRPNSLYNLSKYNVQVSQWNISIVLSRKVPNSKPQFTI